MAERLKDVPYMLVRAVVTDHENDFNNRFISMKYGIDIRDVQMIIDNHNQCKDAHKYLLGCEQMAA